MTTFGDGPAQGQRLMLTRSPKFLRVTESGGKWDALDKPEDKPRPDEKIYAYYRVGEVAGWCHINMGRGRGGFYAIANYRICPEQPGDEVLRIYDRWEEFCMGAEVAK